jgi:hypothetical protein
MVLKEDHSKPVPAVMHNRKLGLNTLNESASAQRDFRLKRRFKTLENAPYSLMVVMQQVALITSHVRVDHCQSVITKKPPSAAHLRVSRY